MTYLVMDNCVGCKHTDCVEVCPVDCFYEGANFLVINPDECIDCGLCEPECPIDAIKCDFDMTPEEVIKWTDINAKYAAEWPVLTSAKAPLPDAIDLNGSPDKFEELFDPTPGTGND